MTHRSKGGSPYPYNRQRRTLITSWRLLPRCDRPLAYLIQNEHEYVAMLSLSKRLRQTSNKLLRAIAPCDALDERSSLALLTHPRLSMNRADV